MIQPKTEPTRKPSLRQVPKSVWVLGFVSMLMDISSEMIHALLPVYLVTVLGASMSVVGLIEGMAEATASIVKIGSGALSDWIGKRKWLAAAGYGLAAFTKPVFPLATSIGWVVAARFIDRIGKGIRGAPRDALIADVTPSHLRGASFGLRQSLDTIGAFVGPLLAIVLMAASSDDFQLVFWFAVIPGFLSFALIVFVVREPDAAGSERTRSWPLNMASARRLGAPFWWFIAVAFVFTLARFSEAFLILRAQQAGTPAAWTPLVLVVMNVVYAMAAYPAGALSDRIDRRKMLMIGLAFLIAGDLVLAFSASLSMIGVGIVLWGLHMAFSQGLMSAMVADAAPAHLRGTAFGLFNFMMGLAMLAASVIAGGLWDWGGPQLTFLCGAGFAIASGALLMLVGDRLYSRDARQV